MSDAATTTTEDPIWSGSRLTPILRDLLRGSPYMEIGMSAVTVAPSEPAVMVSVPWSCSTALASRRANA